MSTIFLSYARGDDEPFVKRLYQDLSARGFSIWWDRETMPGRALTFLQEIRDAITARDRLVLVVAPKAVTSDYVRAEWLYALEIGKAINPVLRLGDYDLLPDELKLLDAPDFRDDGQYATRLETLVRQLSEPVAPMGKLIAVPSLPPHFLHRQDRLRALKDAMLADLHRPVVIPGTVARTGIHGMGGIGKSVLASALARDHEVRRAFPDGVFWVSIGQNPTLVSLQRRVAQALGDPGHFDNEPQGKGKLHELLEHKAVVLVLDDVWDPAHAEAFDVLGPRCRAVITTRDAALITSFGGTSHQVQLLTEAEALALSAEWAECAEDALPPVAREVMAECGHLPLALSICGAMRRDGTSWSDILAALREAELEFLDHPHGNILKSIKVSVDALTPDQARRFAELAVFPPDETVPEAAVATLWSHTGPMKERDARRLLTVLERRALVRLDSEAPVVGADPKRRVSLHDLIYDYATRLASDRVALHQKLLFAYSQRCPEGWSSGPSDGYFFQCLLHHLAEAGRNIELACLLLDLRWLEAKAKAGLVFELVMDFNRAVALLPSTHPGHNHLQLLAKAIGANIQFLARRPTTLFQCLWNQCWWYDCADAAAHYDPPSGGWPTGGPPWSRPATDRLSTLLEAWRESKERNCPGLVWLRSLRPPELALGSPQLSFLRGHTGEVESVAYSPDGRRIVSGAYDQTVRVWDATSGEELACLRGHSGAVRSVAYSPDGRCIVSASDDQTVRVWDAANGEELACLRGHVNFVRSVAYPPNGRRIVTGGNDRTVRVWDAASGVELACLRGHASAVRSVAYAPDGRRIVSGSEDRTVRVWDAASGKELVCLRGHESAVSGVAYSPDSRRIVSGSYDRTVRVWDAASGEELVCLRSHEDWVTSVAYSADGCGIVSGSTDMTVRVWDAAGGKELACLRGNLGWVRSVAYSPDGLRIVSGSDHQTVRVWDAASRAELPRLRGHSGGVNSMAYSPDGFHVVSGSYDRTVRVWDTTSGKELTCLRGHEGSVVSVAYSPDGRRIISGSYDRTVRVWDATIGEELACLRGHSGTVDSVAYSPDGRRIVSGSEDHTVQVWDAASGEKLACLIGNGGEVGSVAYSPDGRRIITESWDNMLRVWDADSGECLEWIDGSGDIAAIAAAGTAFQWRALSRNWDTAIEPVAGGEAVAWFPAAMRGFTTHPCGRIWAGSTENHLYLIRLEGQPDSKNPGGAP